MTYVTPDDIHNSQVAKRLQSHLRLAPNLMPILSPLDAGYTGAMTAAPMMPLQNIPQYTLPTRAVPGRNATSTSPMDTDSRDLGPGGFVPLA